MSSSIKDAMEKAGKLKKAGKPPAVKAIDITVTKIKKVQVTAKREEINRVAEDVRQYLAEIPDHMAGLIGRIREIQGASWEEWLIRTEEFKKLEDEVLSHLNADKGPLLTAACQAYALAMVSTLPADKKAVAETIKGGGESRLPGLIRIGVLKPAEETKNYDVTVRVYGDSYKVVGNKEFGMKIADALSDGAAKAAKAGHDKYHNAVAELKTQATISVVQLLSRKPGLLTIDVPDATISDAKAKDGKKFLAGGVLLAKSDGKTIRVVAAVGHFSKVMEKIIKAETFVPIESLGQERVSLAKRVDEEMFYRIIDLHKILRRGLAAGFARQKPTVFVRLAEVPVGHDERPAAMTLQ